MIDQSNVAFFAAGEVRPLVIHFCHGKTVSLKRLQEAIWIPQTL
jgi:hypothetical protein